MVFANDPEQDLTPSRGTGGQIEGTRHERFMMGEDASGMGLAAFIALAAIGLFAIGDFGGSGDSSDSGFVILLVIFAVVFAAFGLFMMVGPKRSKIVETGTGEIRDVYMEYRRINDSNVLKWYPIITVKGGRQMWGATNNRALIEHRIFEPAIMKVTPTKVNIRGSDDDKAIARSLIRKGFYYELLEPIPVTFAKRESGWIDWELIRDKPQWTD